jgi:hypothetical protein
LTATLAAAGLFTIAAAVCHLARSLHQLDTEPGKAEIQCGAARVP